MRLSFANKLFTMSCGEEDRQTGHANVQLSRKIDAAQSRHDDIGKDKIERLFLKKRKCFRRATRAHRLATQIVQQLFCEVENLDIVFDQKDPDAWRYGGRLAFLLDRRWRLVDLGKYDRKGGARSQS